MEEARQKKIPYRKPEKGQEIVVTGISAKFASCDDIYEFQENLFNKVDCVVGDFGKRHNPELPQKIGKLRNVTKFDAGFFGATIAQSNKMNPVIRIVLEKTIEAIMDAGYHPSDFENTKTGVFCAFSIYGRYATSLKKSSDPIIGAHDSMIAKRISYCLKLKGPAYQLDAACSGSVFALESAYRAITEGKCDKAFVCGVHLCLQPGITLQFMRLGVLSRDGRSKTFDDSADGFASGEGIVTILLERARDAKRVYAEVIHVKTNCDGFKDEGMICPSVKDQSDLFRSFYEECEMDPSIVTFMEAHGTADLSLAITYQFNIMQDYSLASIQLAIKMEDTSDVNNLDFNIMLI